MRTTFDLSPFTRSTIGFDRMFRLLDSMSGTSETPGYPPYNIVKNGDDQYSITVAVAGFGEDELEVKVQDGQLTITSTPEKAEKAEVSYIHREAADHCHRQGQRPQGADRKGRLTGQTASRRKKGRVREGAPLPIQDAGAASGISAARTGSGIGTGRRPSLATQTWTNVPSAAGSSSSPRNRPIS